MASTLSALATSSSNGDWQSRGQCEADKANKASVADATKPKEAIVANKVNEVDKDGKANGLDKLNKADETNATNKAAASDVAIEDIMVNEAHKADEADNTKDNEAKEDIEAFGATEAVETIVKVIEAIEANELPYDDNEAEANNVEADKVVTVDEVIATKVAKEAIAINMARNTNMANEADDTDETIGTSAANDAILVNEANKTNKDDAAKAGVSIESSLFSPFSPTKYTPIFEEVKGYFEIINSLTA